MSEETKNALLIQVADLGIKRLKNGSLSVQEEEDLKAALTKLNLSFEQAIKEAQPILLRRGH